MTPLRLSALAEMIGAELIGAEMIGAEPIHRAEDMQEIWVTAPAAVDSRQVEAGGVFVALPGSRAHGLDFADSAARRGAVAVLAAQPIDVLPTLVVADPVAALGRWAQACVAALPTLRVLALTGSQGKTGTKDFLAAIVAMQGSTVATAGNHNNELGVPLTMLRATADTTYLVLEMGARASGDIRYLCGLASPEVGAVLNVGVAHLGEFGTQAAIAAAKGELIDALPATGVAVLNADDPFTVAMRSRTGARVLTFGEAGQVQARAESADEFGRPSFEIGYAGQWRPVSLSGLGRHHVANACAAAAMALAVGIDLTTIATALTNFRSPARWRMELSERADGLVVINDAYNANPASMEAAIHTLAGIGARTGRRTVAVLGEMRELGAESNQLHRAVGVTAAAAGVDVLVSVGAEAAAIIEGARSVVGWQGTIVPTAGRDEALEWVRHNVSATDVVVVKASRGVALEHLVAGLMNAGEGDQR